MQIWLRLFKSGARCRTNWNDNIKILLFDNRISVFNQQRPWARPHDLRQRNYDLLWPRFGWLCSYACAGRYYADRCFPFKKMYGRLRFTLAHELAHYIIHKWIFCGTGVAAALYNNNADEDAMEWQANYLARAILMPNGQIKRCFYALRPLCISESEFIKQIAAIFEVSKQAIKVISFILPFLIQ